MGHDPTPTDPKHPCPKCPLSLPTLTHLQTHYQTTHDPDWTAGYPSRCTTCNQIHARKDKHDYHRAERHFCTNDCFRHWQQHVDDTSRDNPNVTIDDAVETECAHCDKTLIRERYKLERGDTNRAFCNNTCQGRYRAEHHAGQDHPDWRGGSTELYDSVSALLSDDSWATISTDYRERNPDCEMCGASDGTERGTQNHAHHIVPVLAGGVHVEELLMTLCPSCHSTVERYIEDFAGMERVLIPDDVERGDTPTDPSSTTSASADD